MTQKLYLGKVFPVFSLGFWKYFLQKLKDTEVGKSLWCNMWYYKKEVLVYLMMSWFSLIMKLYQMKATPNTSTYANVNI